MRPLGPIRTEGELAASPDTIAVGSEVPLERSVARALDVGGSDDGPRWEENPTNPLARAVLEVVFRCRYFGQ